MRSENEEDGIVCRTKRLPIIDMLWNLVSKKSGSLKSSIAQSFSREAKEVTVC
jgi:hypothetical protein